MIKRHSIFITILTLLCLSSFAQRKKTEQQAFILLSGKPLNAVDSSKVIDFYYAGLREKVVDNPVLAIESFKQAINIDPLHHPSYYELAQIYFKKGDLSNARIYAEKALTIKTDNQWYWLLVANIYQQQQDYKLLTHALGELIKIEPEKLEYRFDKANALFMMGNLNEALALYNNLEQKIGLTDQVLQGRQRIYLKNGEIKKAIADLQQLIKNNPTDVRYYLSLGDLYFANQMLNDALNVYQQAKQLDDANPFTRMAIAQILESQKKPQEAFEEIKAAFAQPGFSIDQKVKIIIKYFDSFPDVSAVSKAETLSKILTTTHPSDPKSFALYGDVLYQKQDYEGAKLAYQKALALNKNVFVIWEQLLQIALFTNKPNELIAVGEEALTFFPNQVNVYFFVGTGYLINKNYEKAINYLSNALNFEIENKALKTQIYASLGDAYQGQKKYKESSDAYEKALILEPNNSYALNNYAYYLSLRNEDLPKAEKMSVKSNQLEKDNASFQDTYAWILFKLGRYREAEEWMQKAILNNPNNATQFEHLGDIYFKLGNLSSALEYWNKALIIDPNNPLLKKKIADKKYLE